MRTREIYWSFEMAAAVERQTVKDLVIKLIEEKVQDLEKKGMLPKGK